MRQEVNSGLSDIVEATKKIAKETKGYNRKHLSLNQDHNAFSVLFDNGFVARYQDKEGNWYDIQIFQR